MKYSASVYIPSTGTGTPVESIHSVIWSRPSKWSKLGPHWKIC